MCSGFDTVPTDRKVIKYSVHPTMHLARGNCKRLIGKLLVYQAVRHAFR